MTAQQQQRDPPPLPLADDRLEEAAAFSERQRRQWRRAFGLPFADERLEAAFSEHQSRQWMGFDRLASKIDLFFYCLCLCTRRRVDAAPLRVVLALAAAAAAAQLCVPAKSYARARPAINTIRHALTFSYLVGGLLKPARGAGALAVAWSLVAASGAVPTIVATLWYPALVWPGALLHAAASLAALQPLAAPLCAALVPMAAGAAGAAAAVPAASPSRAALLLWRDLGGLLSFGPLGVIIPYTYAEGDEGLGGGAADVHGSSSSITSISSGSDAVLFRSATVSCRAAVTTAQWLGAAAGLSLLAHLERHARSGWLDTRAACCRAALLAGGGAGGSSSGSSGDGDGAGGGDLAAAVAAVDEARLRLPSAAAQAQRLLLCGYFCCLFAWAAASAWHGAMLS